MWLHRPDPLSAALAWHRHMDRVVEQQEAREERAEAAAEVSRSSGRLDWAALAECESGNDPTINTGNGYYGLVQFSLSTWQSVGGEGLPSEATREEQLMRARILYDRAGPGQWPVCGKLL